MALDVGKRLKELREMKKISVNKLSNQAGLSQSFVREIEMGRKNPTVESLGYLCQALDITLFDFFDESLTDSIRNDKALQVIYRLNLHQRETILTFLESLIENDG